MKHFQDFSLTGYSFRERIGKPEEFHAAMGRIALGFSLLEDMASNVLIVLLGVPSGRGHIVAAELSFRQKIELIGSLARHLLPTVVEPSERPETQEIIDEIIFLCRRSEELRNRYLHSSFTEFPSQARAKISAKAHSGLKVSYERINAAVLLDVADFIVYSSMQLDGVPVLLNVADKMTYGADWVSYSKQGVVIAKFKFGEVTDG